LSGFLNQSNSRAIPEHNARGFVNACDKLSTMPLSKKAWKQLEQEARDNVIATVMEFDQNEQYLAQLDSPEPNPLYPALMTSAAVLRQVWDAEPIRVPKLDIVTFSFDETPAPRVEGGQK
jgi:hypothetical protein